MKRTITILFMMIAAISTKNVKSQTNTFPNSGAAGIGTTTPNASSLLEIKSTKKGLLIPRMTKNQRDAIVTPVTGLLIFQTNATPGFYYYDSAAWQPIAPSTTQYWKKNGTSVYYSTGNVGIGLNTPAYKLDVAGDISISSGSVFRINGKQTLYDDAPNQNMFVGDNAGIALNGGYNNIGVGPLSLNKNTNGNYNTAVGANSLTANTGGASNVAVGEKTMYSNTTGYYNAAFGSGALYKNVSANDNTAIGLQSLYNNTSPDNTAVGYKAGYSNTSGLYITAIGNQSLYSNTTGGGNTAVGYLAAYANTTGASITAIGYQALNANTIGSYNTANGTLSLLKNTSGFNNTGIGYGALNLNTTGAYNTAVGCTALLNNTGSSNTAVGEKALQANTSGNFNTALGSGALQNNTTNGGTAIGFQSLFNTTSGNYCTAIGYQAGYSNTSGGVNLFLGEQAGYANTTGSFNCYGGFHAGIANTTGSFNTYYGYGAGLSNIDGNQNTFLGYEAGYLATGDDNTFVGYQSNANTSDPSIKNSGSFGFDALCTAADQIFLGNSTVSEIVSFAEGIFGISDGRYKKNIKENVSGLNFINKLRPVTYTLDVTGINKSLGVIPDQTMDKAASVKETQICNGFIAQEVEQAAKETNYTFSGVHKPQNDKDFYALNYSAFVVPLVKAVQQLSEMNDTKQQQIDSLNADNKLLSDKLDALTAKVNKIENAMSQCCNSFSSNMQMNNLQSSSITKDVARLEQNVPNPFNGTSTVNYYIPQAFHTAQLMITNSAGQTLKVYPITSPGFGNQILNGKDFTSGTYQYSLLIDGKIYGTKKMITAK